MVLLIYKTDRFPKSLFLHDPTFMNLFICLMDILELSRKMEADLLESRTTIKKTLPDNFSPRVTRSKLKAKKPLPEPIPEAEPPPPKRCHSKVDEVENIYLNKKATVVHKNLETIYENPIWKKGSTMLLGKNKVKRSIYLNREFRITSKQKSKLRKMKIKRLGKCSKPYKMSDDEFRSKMSMIENYINENDIEIDVEFENDQKFKLRTTDESNTESNSSNELSE